MINEGERKNRTAAPSPREMDTRKATVVSTGTRWHWTPAGKNKRLRGRAKTTGDYSKKI